ncbi:MAG: hypothetical protein K0Q64_2217 [Nitrobacter vulgaris]|jgi:hypothetical protein|nr:hypothetical protein [Nitrobacter vulgaris]MCI3951140.1 hypothetical protein [Burkholderiales bacterium]
MDSDKHAAFSVMGYEVNIIPGTEYAFIRLALVDKPLQTRPVARHYVFSYGQLAELRDEIDAALRLSKEALQNELDMPRLH